MRFLTSIFLLVSFTGFSQFISIKYPGIDVDISGTYTYVIQSEEDDPTDLSRNLWIYNETSSPIDVSCRRVEIDVMSHTENATCWRVCPPPIASGSQVNWTSQYVQTIQPGEYDHTFSPHLYPENLEGCSHFRYYFYVEGQPNMIDSIDYYFNHGEVCQQVASTSTLEPIKESIKVYPNPSMGQVNIDLNLAHGKTYNLSVVNVVGQNVVSLSNVPTGLNQYNWSNLNAGLYFVVIDDGEKTVMTEKIQISK